MKSTLNGFFSRTGFQFLERLYLRSIRKVEFEPCVWQMLSVYALRSVSVCLSGVSQFVAVVHSGRVARLRRFS